MLGGMKALGTVLLEIRSYIKTRKDREQLAGVYLVSLFCSLVCLSGDAPLRCTNRTQPVSWCSRAVFSLGTHIKH